MTSRTDIGSVTALNIVFSKGKTMSETIVTKRCSKCKQAKSISEFHKNRSKKDGFHHYCKVCTKAYQKSEKGRAITNRYQQSKKGKASQKRNNQSEAHKAAMRRYNRSERGKARDRLYRKTARAKANRAKGTARYNKRHPIKFIAVQAVRAAVTVGYLPKAASLPCKYCSKPASQYHHPKYELERLLDVIPVCTKCHSMLHRNNHAQ